MSLARRSKAAVEECHERLRAEYGSFERLERTWPLSNEGYDRTVERFEQGTVGGAGVWVTDDRGRALLVRHEGEEGWSEPAGKIEPGETPEGAARREVEEETGVTCTIDDLHLTQVIEATDADDPERSPIYRLIVVFAGSYVSGDLQPEEGEIAEVRWWTDYPDELLYDEIRRLPMPAAEQ